MKDHKKELSFRWETTFDSKKYRESLQKNDAKPVSSESNPTEHTATERKKPKQAVKPKRPEFYPVNAPPGMSQTEWDGKCSEKFSDWVPKHQQPPTETA